VEPAPVTAEEFPAFVTAFQAAFHRETEPLDVVRLLRIVERERTLAVREDGRIVATTAIHSRHLTVPGGEVPVAAVTLVGVLPTHRRRGLMTALMRRQLADVHDAGAEAVAALWASEAAIYGRFGYGMAAENAELRVDRVHAGLRMAPTRQVRLCRPADAVEAMRPIHDAARRSRPGMLDRAGLWWEVRIDDPEAERDGTGPLRAAVVDDAAYALYAIREQWQDRRAASEVRVRELVASTPEGAAAIWGFLLGLDLTSRLVYEMAPRDEPLVHMLADGRAVRTAVGDSLWVRLVDLPRALTERFYLQPFEVVLEVGDEVCPWNAGRWALRWDGTAATCARTALPAGLALGAAELGAAHLGGTTLDVLARAGRVRELRPGALAAASRGFAWDRAPWCPEIF